MEMFITRKNKVHFHDRGAAYHMVPKRLTMHYSGNEKEADGFGESARIVEVFMESQKSDSETMELLRMIAKAIRDRAIDS